MAKTDIKVKLVGEDGNAFAILGRCRQALARARRLDLWNEFHKEATSGDYNHLLTTVCDYFEVDYFGENEEDSKLRAPATGLFLIYAIHTNPFITPRLAPIAANSPRVPPGRFSRYAIIALWAVSGQTWAFLLSHTHLRCPIKINAYFQLLYPLFTCYFSDPCCPEKSTFFLPFLTQLHLTKIAS